MLVAAALVALPSTALADATVWFELGAGSSDDIMAVGGGQEGSVLELTKSTLTGDSTLELVMFTNVTGTSLYSVSTTLAAQGDAADAYTGAGFAGIAPDGGAVNASRLDGYWSRFLVQRLWCRHVFGSRLSWRHRVGYTHHRCLKG